MFPMTTTHVHETVAAPSSDPSSILPAGVPDVNGWSTTEARFPSDRAG